MDYAYSSLVKQARHWSQDAVTAGWLSENDANILLEFDARTPDTLFAKNESRPLIVAFLGGTGVGKSSLLNRLAGIEIAKTGVERPTSREVTLYHHESIRIDTLPEQLPLEKIKLARHNDASRKQVIWIDMPDFDSTEKKNKQLVLEWLPHIDILVYVVSPERYRDNKAWQLLLSVGARHAWLFVLNQFDRGRPEQFEDFILQLGKAGFKDPIVYRTSCLEDKEAGQIDEFAGLQQTIVTLSSEHIVEQLKLRGVQVRLLELKEKMQNCLLQLGTQEATEQLLTYWRSSWPETEEVLQKGFTWPMQGLAAYYANHTGRLMNKKIAQAVEGEPVKMQKTVLWDDWAQNRYNDALDGVVLKSDQLTLPTAPVKQALADQREKAALIIHSQMELCAREALANPGNKWQRYLLNIVRVSEIILPLTAMAWVCYQVLHGFYESSITDVAYLGWNFAIHSTLLIAISWLLPYFIRRQLKPSLEKSVLKGLRKGLTMALAMIEVEIETALIENTKQQIKIMSQAQEIIVQCESEPSVQLAKNDDTLQRMLID